MSALMGIGGDTFNSSVQLMSLPYNDTGDTSTLTNTIANASNDAFYLINSILPLTNVDIDLTGSAFDTYLWVYASDMNTVLWSNDDYNGTLQSALMDLTLNANTDYYIVVEGFSSNNGNYTLNVSSDYVGSIVDPDAPSPISNQNPADGAINVALLPTLTWTFGANTETYDLYLDTVNPPLTAVVTGAASGVTGSYTPPGDLLDSTVYYWRVVSHNSITTNAVMSTMRFNTVILPITNFPSIETFEQGGVLPISWMQGNEDQADWMVGTSTPNWQTGPQNGDHTSGAGYFVYTNSIGQTGLRHDLLAQPVDVSALTNPYCTAWVCMYGATMGSMHFDVWDGTQWNEDVRPAITGDQGLDWQIVDTDLSAFTGTIQLRFRAIAGTDWQTDMAIDDVSFWDNGSIPGASTIVLPANNSIGITMTGNIAWTAVPGVSGYYVSMGTDNPPTNVYNMVDVGNVLSYDYSGLASGTVYNWQITPYNAIGSAVNCPIWSFTTFNDIPNPATLISPMDGAQSVSETPTLQWANGGNFPDGYRLYLGTDNPPTNIINGDNMALATSFDITNALGFETTHYWQVVPYNFVGDAANCPVWSFTTNSNQNFGGDGNLYGGYYFANSTPSGGGLGYQPVFEWVDISTTGQTPTFSNADDGYATVDIGFTFNFFGNDYTQVSLGTNGLIMFTNPTGTTCWEFTIPGSDEPNDCIAMMAEDLHTANIPSLCYYGNDELGNFVYTVMMWNDYSDSSEYMDIQVILYPTGRIKIQYNNYVNPNGDTGQNSLYGDGTIGIENMTGTIGHQYSCDGVGGPVNDQMALCYALTPSDLSDGGAGLYLPNNIEYGVVNVNSNSAEYNVRMRNFSDTSLTVAQPVALAGATPDQFLLTDNNTYPLVIPQGGEANVSVIFHPTSVGHKTATLTIIDDFVEPTRINHEITMHGYGFIADSNDTSITATEFALYSAPIQGLEAIIQPETDIDWYAFWQSGPAEIEMHTEQMYNSEVDLSAFLYGPYGELGINVDEYSSIAFDDDSWTDGVSPHLIANVTESGFYYLRVARTDNSPTRSNASHSVRNSLKTERIASREKLTEVSSLSTSTNERIERWDTGDYALWVSTDNPTPPPGFEPPTELDAEITYQGIYLTWLTPDTDTRNLIGYNIYRDGLMINQELVTSLFYLDSDSALTVDQSYEYEVTAYYTAPTGESEPCESIDVVFVTVDPPIIAEGFENYDNFVTQFGSWTILDEDGENTFGFNNGIDFPGENNQMAFIVFNPTATTPPLQFAAAYSGVKYAACFAADTGTNDDWLITPQIQLSNNPATVRLMARSYTTQFGMERFEIAVSNGSANPSDFTVISGDQPVEVPIAWTPYSYSLDAYAGEIVRVALHGVSNQTFFMMVDDIMVVNNGAFVDIDPQPVIPEVTALHGNYPNPFNPETSIRFDLKENSKVTIDVYNIKGQRIATVAERSFNAGRHNVTWKGTDNNGNSVASGVYFYKMNCGTYTKTRKMILMK
jgi:hypothetical protein